MRGTPAKFRVKTVLSLVVAPVVWGSPGAITGREAIHKYPIWPLQRLSTYDYRASLALTFKKLNLIALTRIKAVENLDVKAVRR